MASFCQFEQMWLVFFVIILPCRLLVPLSFSGGFSPLFVVHLRGESPLYYAVVLSLFFIKGRSPIFKQGVSRSVDPEHLPSLLVARSLAGTGLCYHCWSIAFVGSKAWEASPHSGIVGALFPPLVIFLRQVCGLRDSSLLLVVFPMGAPRYYFSRGLLHLLSLERSHKYKLTWEMSPPFSATSSITDLPFLLLFSLSSYCEALLVLLVDAGRSP